MLHNEDVLLNNWEQRRDAEAFRAIVVRYSGMVHATCRRILNDTTEAEDVTQECFEALAAARRTPKGYLGPWLHRVASNLASRRVRDSRRRQDREGLYAETQENTTNPTWNDIYPYVDEALNNLPESLRIPVTAHYLEGATQQAIAGRMGIAESTVRYRIKQGLDRIGRTLRRHGIIAGAAALAALLDEGLAEATHVSAQLIDRLGRLSLAQTGKGTWWSSLHVKGLGLGAVVAAAAVLISFWSSINDWGSPDRSHVASAGANDTTQYENAGMEDPLSDTQAVSAAIEDTDSVTPPTVARPALPLLSEGIPDAFAYLYYPIEPGDGSFRGVVYEPDGTPSVGARVTVFRSDSWWKHGYAETVTDDDGRYILEGIGQGSYQITAASSRGVVSSYTALYPESFLRDRFEELNLLYILPRNLGNPDKGTHKTKNLTIEAFDETGISGCVVDPEGTPVAGALIVTRGRPGLMKSLTLNIRTDSEGRFEFPYATDSLTAYADGYAPTSLDEVEAWSADNEIVLEAASHIAGTARMDKTGEPVIGATVILRAVREHDPRMTAVTDKMGRFLLPCLATKKYQMMVSEPGAGWASLEAPILNLSETGSLDDFELLVGEGATIAGRAYIKETGEPLPGLRITIPNSRTSDVMRRVKTDADGRYRLPNLPAGEYYVQCSPADNVVSKFYYVDQGPAGPRQRVELAAAEQRTDLDFVFEAGATVSGQVTDATGKPIAGAMLSAKDERRGEGYGPESLPLATSVVSTNSEGRYELSGFSASNPYPYRMNVSARGYGLLTSEPFKVTGDTVGKDFILEAAAAVSGKVTDMAGMPLFMVMISLETEDRSNRKPRPRGALSGVDGRFRFTEGAFPGTYHIGVSGWFNQDLDVPWRGHAMMPPIVIKDASPVQDLHVVVPSRPECAVLSGRVFEYNTAHIIQGAAVEVSQLNVNGEDYGAHAGDFKIDNATGVFTLSYVYPGTVTLSAWAEGYPKQEVMTLDVTSGMKREDLSLSLKKEWQVRAVIEGRVTVDGEVNPPTQRTLWLSSPDVKVPQKQFGVDEQGFYRVENLEPGRYFLTVGSYEWTPDHVFRWHRQDAVDIVAEQGMTYTNDFELGGSGTLTGTVSVPHATTNVRVSLRPANMPGPFPDSSVDYEEYCRQVVAVAVRMSPAGQYLIRRVPAGNYEVALTYDLHVRAQEPRFLGTCQVHISSNEETVLDLVP